MAILSSNVLPVRAARVPLRQQRHLEVRALGLCAFKRGGPSSRPFGWRACGRVSRVFFSRCRLPLQVTVVAWGSIAKAYIIEYTTFGFFVFKRVVSRVVFKKFFDAFFDAFFRRKNQKFRYPKSRNIVTKAYIICLGLFRFSLSQ